MHSSKHSIDKSLSTLYPESEGVKIYRMNEKGQRVLKEIISPEKYAQMKKNYGRIQQSQTASSNQPSSIRRNGGSQKQQQLKDENQQSFSKKTQNSILHSRAGVPMQSVMVEESSVNIRAETHLLESPMVKSHRRVRQDQPQSNELKNYISHNSDRTRKTQVFSKNNINGTKLSNPAMAHSMKGYGQRRQNERNIIDTATNDSKSQHSKKYYSSNWQKLASSSPKTRKAALVQTLFELSKRRKSYVFQLLKQFILFGAQESESQLESFGLYDRLLLDDEVLHTMRKIYETKQVQSKIWAFLNIKFWPLTKKLTKFTEKVESGMQKYQTRVTKLMKKESFKQIFQYSKRVVISTPKASDPTPIVQQSTLKESSAISSSKSRPGQIYTPSVSKIPSSRVISREVRQISNVNEFRRESTIERDYRRVYRIENSPTMQLSAHRRVDSQIVGRKYQLPKKTIESEQPTRVEYYNTLSNQDYTKSNSYYLIKDQQNSHKRLQQESQVSKSGSHSCHGCCHHQHSTNQKHRTCCQHNHDETPVAQYHYYYYGGPTLCNNKQQQKPHNKKKHNHKCQHKLSKSKLSNNSNHSNNKLNESNKRFQREGSRVSRTHKCSTTSLERSRKFPSQPYLPLLVQQQKQHRHNGNQEFCEHGYKLRKSQLQISPSGENDRQSRNSMNAGSNDRNGRQVHHNSNYYCETNKNDSSKYDVDQRISYMKQLQTQVHSSSSNNRSSLINQQNAYEWDQKRRCYVRRHSSCNPFN